MTFTKDVFPEAFVIYGASVSFHEIHERHTCSPTTDISAALEKKMLENPMSEAL